MKNRKSIVIQGTGYNPEWVSTQTLDAFLSYAAKQGWGETVDGNTVTKEGQQQHLTEVYYKITGKEPKPPKEPKKDQ